MRELVEKLKRKIDVWSCYLTGNVLKGLRAANNPSINNPFATIADLVGGGGNIEVFEVVDPTLYQTSILTFDLLGGTSVIPGTELNNILPGEYLVFFNMTAHHTNPNGQITIGIESEGILVPNGLAVYRRGAGQGNVTTPLSFIAFPLTIGATTDVKIHWYTSGPNAESAFRNLTLIKVG